MSRYEPLTRFLEGTHTSQIQLTFQDIERILDRPLPASARQHQAWWSNTETHSHADSWMRTGWRTRDLDLGSERILFYRNAGPAAAPPSTSAKPPSGSASSIVLARDALSPAALNLVERHAAEHDCSQSEAVADILSEAAIERKRRLLDRFPLVGERSLIDSATLIREDRDAR